MEVIESQKKLIDLMRSQDSRNMEMGIYQWLSQGFSKMELVEEFIKCEYLSGCTGWEAYDVEIGNISFCAGVSDYSVYPDDRADGRCALFYWMSLRRSCGSILYEVVPQSTVDEHAKYYLHKMFDLLDEFVQAAKIA